MAVQYFLLWSRERKSYWHHSHHGYTNDLYHAARFTLEEAVRECNAANLFPTKPPNDLIVPLNPAWIETKDVIP